MFVIESGAGSLVYLASTDAIPVPDRELSDMAMDMDQSDFVGLVSDDRFMVKSGFSPVCEKHRSPSSCEVASTRVNGPHDVVIRCDCDDDAWSDLAFGWILFLEGDERRFDRTSFRVVR